MHDGDGQADDVLRALDREAIARARATGRPVWVDLVGPSDEEVTALAEVFGFHPLAVEDARHFGQRPKVEDYDEHVFVVAYGYDDARDALIEVHCFLAAGALVTVRREDGAALASLEARAARRGAYPHGAMGLHAVLDALTDSLSAMLTDIDAELASFDDRALAGDRALQGGILGLRRRLVTASQIVGAQADTVARIASGLMPVPGLDRDAERYFRDVHDHLLRIAGAIDGHRELLTGVTGVLLAASSNALGDVTRQLTVIATLFLPLSFIAGFFGQNFPWLVDRIGGPVPFLTLGLGLQAGVAAALVLWFRRKGWV
ncbi:MAG TPA: magnesium transporter CorA family protein [Miltoncostaeaceae bacterium]|nr:magnesium transporter CorA family protein [Miltoncostaeaceae bacterium]